MTTAEELRQVLLGMLAQLCAMGAPAWFVDSERARLHNLPAQSVQAFRAWDRGWRLALDLEQGLQPSPAYTELRAAAAELWALLESEWRLGGGGV